jgi:hypothetical protein
VNRQGEHDRRRVARGGRRAIDRLSLTPELRAQANEYATVIERCLDTLTAALADGDLVGARLAANTLKDAANALRALLAGETPNT